MMETEWFLPILLNGRVGPQKVIKASANNSVILKPKIQVRGVFQSVKLMESRCLIKFLKFWILGQAIF